MLSSNQTDARVQTATESENLDVESIVSADRFARSDERHPHDQAVRLGA